jgi:hypothetical protein
MNQYRCETCKNIDCVFAEKWRTTWHSDMYYFINKMGCASHSSFQSERDKVLDEVILRINNLLNGLYEEKRKSFWFRLSQAKSNSIAEFTLRYVADMVKELRQKDGERG